MRVAGVIDTVNKNIDFSHRLPAVDLDQILTTAVEDMERRTPTKTPSFVLPPHSCIKHHKRSVNHALRNQELKIQRSYNLEKRKIASMVKCIKYFSQKYWHVHLQEADLVTSTA